MLTKIWVNNFKAHDDTAIELRRITLFIGPNNSGKSSLGQAILGLRQAAHRGSSNLSYSVQRKTTSLVDPYLYQEDQLIDLGEFGHIVRRGQHDVLIGLEGQIRASASSGLQLSFEVSFRDDVLNFHKGRIGYTTPVAPGDREITWQWVAGGPTPGPVPPILLSGGQVQVMFQAPGNLQLILAAGISYGPNVSPQTVTEVQSLQQRLASAPLSLMNSVHPIFPLRGLEERGSPLTEGPARNLERLSVADRTVALLSMLAYDLDLQERISDWLENLIERRIKVPLLPGKRVTLLSVSPRPRGDESLFANEGTGANQLPFILVPIGISPPGETILLTEPEAHLHPQLQSKLTSLLLSLAEKENRQFIVETHSEHVLHYVLYAIAKGELSTSDVTMYYFEKKDDTARCRKLEINEKGQVEGGLPGFFDQSVNELSEYLEALKKN